MSQVLKVITQPESWRQEVKADVVSCLKELLEIAESGELQGIAYSSVTVDGCVRTGFTKNSGHSAVIGGLERVKYRMVSGETD